MGNEVDVWLGDGVGKPEVDMRDAAGVIVTAGNVLGDAVGLADLTQAARQTAQMMSPRGEQIQ